MIFDISKNQTALFIEYIMLEHGFAIQISTEKRILKRTDRPVSEFPQHQLAPQASEPKLYCGTVEYLMPITFPMMPASDETAAGGRRMLTP